MELEYKKLVKTIIERLTTAHDSTKAKIRGMFFQKENQFFKEHIKNQRVLVAGSGLGHDSFELARYNKKIVGIELLKELINIAQEKLKKFGLRNIEFKQGDFTKLQYPDNHFDSAVLNMGTISDFKNRAETIKELLRVSNTVYLDFYPPTSKGLQTRKKMYKEEEWQNVRIKGNVVISDDGLFSTSISKREISEMVEAIGAKVKYYPLRDFAVMAEIRKNRTV
jgi:ubiquinone/menaquinone biosynthesis C-methylase UbiE